MKTHYKKCPECSEVYVNDEMLNTHIRNVHELSCDKCNFKSAKKEMLSKHMRSNHPNESICGKCGKSFLSEVECRKHTELCDSHKRNQNIGFPCDECQEMFVSIKDLMKHKIEDHQFMNDKKTATASDKVTEDISENALGIFQDALKTQSKIMQEVVNKLEILTENQLR